jgi:hypothetical protein
MNMLLVTSYRYVPKEFTTNTSFAEFNFRCFPNVIRVVVIAPMPMDSNVRQTSNTGCP